MTPTPNETLRDLPALPPGVTAADCVAWAEGRLDGPRADALEKAATAEPMLLAVLEGLTPAVVVRPAPAPFADRMRLLTGPTRQARPASWLAAAALILILASIPAALEIARALDRVGASPTVASIAPDASGSHPSLPEHPTVADIGTDDDGFATTVALYTSSAGSRDLFSADVRLDAELLSRAIAALGTTRSAGEGRSMAERLYGIARLWTDIQEGDVASAPPDLLAPIRERLDQLSGDDGF